MQRLLLFLLLAGCGVTSDQASDPNPPSVPGTGRTATAEPGGAYDFVEAPGVIRTLEIGGSTPLFVVHPDADPDTRYCLATEELPEDLRRDGVRVVFTGTREEIPANHRMACSPLALESIEKE